MKGYFAWDDEHLDDSLSVEFKYTDQYRQYTGQDLSMRELKCLEIALPAAAAVVLILIAILTVLIVRHIKKKRMKTR